MGKGINLNRLMVLALNIATISLNSDVIDALSASPQAPPAKERVAAGANAAKRLEGMVVVRKARDPDSPTMEKSVKPCDPYPVKSGVVHGIAYDISQGFSAIAEKAVLAVVNVSTTQIIEGGRFGGKDGLPQFPPGSPFEDFFRDFLDSQPRARKVQSLGSGFIVQSDESTAVIVTNYHVVADAKKVVVFLHDMTELEASVLAIDERTDIALLKVKTDSLPADKRRLPTMGWADGVTTKVGDWVLAIGNPFGLGSTVTRGIVSNRARDIMMGQGQVGGYADEFIQHDASLNMGNSGGPLINLAGKVIAINTAIYSPSGGSVGIGFGIPSSVARDTVGQLLASGRVKRGWLGIRFQPVTKDIAESFGLGRLGGGIIVGSVTPGGPAAKAGLGAGDIILQFDDKEINDQTKLPRLVGATPVGKTVKIKVWRQGKEKTLDLVLEEFRTLMDQEKYPAAEKSRISQDVVEVSGIKMTALTPELKERFKLGRETTGVLVRKVDVESTAMEVGLRTGDVIEKVNQKAITRPEDFAKAVEEAKEAKRKNILLLVTRGGGSFFVPLKLEAEDLRDDAHSKDKDPHKEPQK